MSTKAHIIVTTGRLTADDCVICMISQMLRGMPP